MSKVGEILIVIGGDQRPLNRELDKAKSGLSAFGRVADSMGINLGRAMTVGATGIVAAATAMAAMTARAMQNIDAISKQARVAGLSVAAFQTMAQVAEEAGVETDALSKILVKMQDNINSLGKGAAAQVAAFSALGLSMSDLAGLSTDEQFAKIAEALSEISDPAAKTAAALDVFGKSGAAALNMVDGYADAAANAAEFQRAFGLAVSDTDAQQIEAANDALGRMWQAFDGVGNILAAKAAPGLELFANAMLGLIENAFSAETAISKLFGTLDRAKAVLGEDVYDSLLKTAGGLEDNAKEIDALVYVWDDLQQTVRTNISAMSGDIAALADAGAADLALQLDAVVGEMEQLTEEFHAGTITAEEFEQRMGEAAATATTLFEQASSIDGVDMSGAVAAVGRLTQALAVAFGVATKLKAALPGGGTDFKALPDDRRAAISDAGVTQGGFIGETITTSPRPRAAPNNIDFGLPEISTATGGGGRADKYAQRMEAIVNSLKTERELIEEWYQESYDLLQSASDAELEALGGKHAALERLEKEHQERLSGIQDEAMAARLADTANFFGALADLTSAGGQRLAKATAAAEAIQGTINAYGAAVKALNTPGLTLGARFAAYASVLAAGLKGVAAIRQAGGGGGGGVAQAPAAAASAQAPAPGPTPVNIQWMGGMTAASLGSLTKQLNQELKYGYTLNLVAG